MTKRFTDAKAGKTYWNGNSAYQDELEEIFPNLVPKFGEASTVHGELLRAFTNLFYEHSNNGNGNAVTSDLEYEWVHCYACRGDEDCDCCGGEGEYEEEYEGDYYITGFFKEHLDFIKEYVEGVQVLESAILNTYMQCDNVIFSDEVYQKYNNVGDNIMHYILTTENQPR
jgi:hypothetical protein